MKKKNYIDQIKQEPQMKPNWNQNPLIKKQSIATSEKVGVNLFSRCFNGKDSGLW